MNAENHFFSIEEALVRLGQTGDIGCLMVYTMNESIRLFTANGRIVCASSGSREGEEVIEHALQLENAFYTWIPGAVPEAKNIEVSIQAHALKHAIKRDVNIAETSKVAFKFEEREVERVSELREVKEKKAIPDYYLLPEEHPTASIKLTRLTSIVGRDETCDLVIPNNQLSRRHCLLDITARGLLVRDLNSTNGTYVNGHFIKEGYMNAGDRLILGTYVMILQKAEPSGKASLNKTLQMAGKELIGK